MYECKLLLCCSCCCYDAPVVVSASNQDIYKSSQFIYEQIQENVIFSHSTLQYIYNRQLETLCCWFMICITAAWYNDSSPGVIER